MSESSTKLNQRDTGEVASLRARVDAQLRGWASLRALHPSTIDFERLHLIRSADRAALATPEGTTELVLALGLNDEGVSQYPEHLHGHFGGLRIWQYPEQFGPYLHHLAQLDVRSYLEIGVRHGGSFLATVEYLQRHAPLTLALGVDVIPAPALAAYTKDHPQVRLAWLDSRSDAFRQLLAACGPFDLAFIDSHHEEAQCRAEIALLAPHVRMIAFHDVTNVWCPGVGTVWRELMASSDWECVEFTKQYEGMGPYMGIGLAKKRGVIA